MNTKLAFISFFTHSSHLNYGATLHGYAFQTYLKKCGVDSIGISYIPKLLKGENLKYPILNKRRKGRSLLMWVLVKINWLLGFKSNIIKYKKFDSFINKKMTVTKNVYTYESLKKCEKIDNTDFDIFVCEADIIWKIFDEDSIDENFFLTFPAAKNKRKVAYAPTISSKGLDGELLKKFIELVKPFDSVSAREKQGAEYLSKVLNREVTYVLDPTLLLDEEDYSQILIPAKEKDYLLIYNCTVNDIRMVKEAIKYGKEHNLRVIEVSNYALNRYAVWHEVRTNVGIEEWLGLIKNAKVIFTNSFHGLCFSIIFKKVFFLFQRDNKDFRMQSIVESLGVQDRLIPCDTRQINEGARDIDYKKVYENLDGLRKVSYDYIQKNIINYLS